MVRRRRIRYTPEFKAEALRRLQQSDQPIRYLARDVGVSHHAASVDRRRPAGRRRAADDGRAAHTSRLNLRAIYWKPVFNVLEAFLC